MGARAELRATARPAGFTLVELMVVIVIVGLIGTVAVGTWASMLPKQEFHTAIRNLSEVLYGTRSDAIARNREFDLEYDLSDDSYRVRTPFKAGGGFAVNEDDPERLWTHETSLREKGLEILQVTVGDEVFTDGKCYQWFLPQGVTSYHLVELRSEALGETFTLEVLPLTGEIRLHEGSYAREPVDEGDFR